MLPVFTAVAAAMAAWAAAEEPRVPPYGYTLSGPSCPGARSERESPWDVFNEETWQKLEKTDQRAIVDGYCAQGPSYLENYRFARSRMLRVLGGGASLAEVKEADAATDKAIDRACEAKLDDGRHACKSCCQHLVTLHGRLIELEGQLTGKRLQERSQQAAETGTLRDAKRLQAAGISGNTAVQAKRNEELFSNSGGRRTAAGDDGRGSDERRAAIESDEVKGGALRDPPRRREARAKEPPPAMTASEREAAYIRQQKEDAIFGAGWLAERRAKEEIEGLHAYVKNCYEEHPNSAWCFCKKKTTRELQDMADSAGNMCRSELLKRKLGQ